MFITFHEYGHFMAGELKLPVTGPEEDMADEFAAMTWIEVLKKHPEMAPLALGGAKFWFFLAYRKGAQQSQPPWYDEHAPDARRFGAVLCMLYGAYPEYFGSVIDKLRMPDARRQSCVQQAGRRAEAWKTLLRPHRRAGVNVNFPGDLPAETKGGRITADYQPSKTPEGEMMHTPETGASARTARLPTWPLMLPSSPITRTTGPPSPLRGSRHPPRQAPANGDCAQAAAGSSRSKARIMRTMYALPRRRTHRAGCRAGG